MLLKNNIKLRKAPSTTFQEIANYISVALAVALSIVGVIFYNFYTPNIPYLLWTIKLGYRGVYIFYYHLLKTDSGYPVEPSI